MLSTLRILLILCQLMLFPSSIFASKSNRKYLYENNSEPVLEYLASNSTNATQDLYPDFLYSTNNTSSRMVVFYAPWCGHCRKYQPKFVKLARAIQNVSDEVRFHAVSCTVHRLLCKAKAVWSYPTVMVYQAGSINGTVVRASSHLFVFLDKLGLTYDGDKEGDHNVEYTESSDFDDDGDILSTQHTTTSKHGKSSIHLQNKQNVYADAWQSLDYSLRNHIFLMEPNGTLTNTTHRKVFAHWIKLLFETIPYQHEMHHLVSAIYRNGTGVMKNETLLLDILDQHAPPSDEWSADCPMGFTCGLWQLFHIVTIGVVEWNEHGLDSRHTRQTSDAANIIRDYVATFFPCMDCRQNFLSDYDACRYNRCNRLTEDAWRQLPLWLWETHNGVNARLKSSQWPSKQACPTCWLDNGTWVEDQIYKYLRVQYWPNDATSTKYRQEFVAFAPNINFLDDMPPPWISLLPMLFIFFFWCVWRRGRQERIKRHRTRRWRLHGTDQLLTKGLAHTRNVLSN